VDARLSVKNWPVLLAVIAAGCGAPTASEVKAAFLGENPQALIFSVGTGEGDADNLYYHIRYRLPPDTTLWQQVWLYQRGADGRWGVTYRDTTTAGGAT
jgi:hypothetical protein